MTVLLDSYSFAWFLTGNSRLSGRASVAVQAPEATVLVSAASAWEIATKARTGRWPEAQAIVEDLTLVTADPAFRAFGVRVLW